MARKLNVLFILIDSLRFDRLKLGGYPFSPCPTLEGLIESGVYFTNVFSTGNVTQISMPSIFTSTLPLDYGGYTLGIRRRPVSFVEVIRDAGYMTAGFVSSPVVNSLEGYNRGFNVFNQFFNISEIFRIFNKLHIQRRLIQINSGIMSRYEAILGLNSYLPALFTFLHDFIDTTMTDSKRRDLHKSRLIHSWDFNRLNDIIKNDESRFRNDPDGYIDELLRPETGNLLISLLSKIMPDTINSSYLIDVFLKWLDDTRERPFFAYLHCFDVHEKRYIHGEYTNSNSYSSFDKFSMLHKNILDNGSSYNGDPAYDFSACHVDHEIERVINYLKKSGLYDDTLILITSDHGISAGFPRSNVDITQLYDELLHIPLAFVHRDIFPRKIDSLCSTIDIAPSLLDLLGLPCPNHYKGKSLFSKDHNPRPYVFIESMGKGPCDFASKPIRVCVRSKERKLNYESNPRDIKYSGKVVSYFNLEDDPNEFRERKGDLYNEVPFISMKEAAIDRCKEILLSLPMEMAVRVKEARKRLPGITNKHFIKARTKEVIYRFSKKFFHKG